MADDERWKARVEVQDEGAHENREPFEPEEQRGKPVQHQVGPFFDARKHSVT
jgi:hypothetical protein